MLHVSLTIALIFLFFSIIFYIFKEKSTILIGRYNILSKEQKKNYDELKMSKDFTVIYLKSSLIFFIGAVGCVVVIESSFWVALIFWLIYFTRKFKDCDKLLNKYKLDRF